MKKIKSIFADDRGEIFDIFVKSPKEHCSVVTFKNGAIRGNHFHKKTTQFTYVLEGKFKIYSVKVNNKGNPIKKVKIFNVSQHSLITHEPFEAHAVKLQSKKGIILAFACGVRGGSSYELDTFRLKDPLIS